jgi:transposase-like protein
MGCGELMEKPSCPHCKSRDVIKRGFNITLRGRIQRYQCKSCGHTFQAEKAEGRKRE